MRHDENDDLKLKVEQLIKKQSKKDEQYIKPKERLGFEQARDGFRFFTNLLYVSMIVCFLALVFSYGCYLFKEKAHSYVTSTNGEVVEIKPYKIM
ncbi:hypothetical protein [Aeromonas veronii]|jgi:hypothetical protein|uniref:Bacterial virulence protein VirB8 domain-containing protein n=1 Tax=Aeromonas veronii TaxID=654 RepID=A0A2T4MX27_AERVE|nr:hypothetical protein [Aeromonas veronii]PTH79143.1 hypothetical protein DAA48_22185 [Aeromonas veronii]